MPQGKKGKLGGEIVLGNVPFSQNKRYYFEVDINKGKNLFIGVAISNSIPNVDINSQTILKSNKAWILKIDEGKLWHNGKSK